MKSLVELQRLAVRRLLGVDMNDGFIEKLVVLFRPLPTSEIKLLNWTRKEKYVKLKRLERFSYYLERVLPCCCRDVGDGDGAGDPLLELGDSDTKEPFDWLIPEFRFWTLGVLADDTRRRDTSRDGWDELGELLQSANKLALWTDRADSLTGLIPGVIEMRISDELQLLFYAVE